MLLALIRQGGHGFGSGLEPSLLGFSCFGEPPALAALHRALPLAPSTTPAPEELFISLVEEMEELR